jgi:AraC family transcriptional regulator of arabinose operon
LIYDNLLRVIEVNKCVNLYLNNMLRILDLGFANTKDLYTHPNRKLDWNVFLYVSEGEMEVWEEEAEYIISKGKYLFLKRSASLRGA